MTTAENISHDYKLILINPGIGNLDDLSARNILALKQGKYFVVEDTRFFINLMKRLNIPLDHKVWQSLHDHSGQDKIHWVLDHLNKDHVYYVSEAGSAIISDPVLPLLQQVISRGIAIDSYSGISSVIIALELAGLPCNPFTFYGFLRREKSKKEQFFIELANKKGTHVFFEGPSRVQETLALIGEILPQADIAICREMTKPYQTIYRGKASEQFSLDVRGEFVIVLYNSGQSLNSLEHSKVVQLAQDVLKHQGKSKKLAKLLSEILGEDVSEIYKKLNH